MPGTEILRVRNCIHISVILYFYIELMSKSVSLKILELKLVKLGWTIIYLDLDTIKNARNELNEAGELPLPSCHLVT